MALATCRPFHLSLVPRQRLLKRLRAAGDGEDRRVSFVKEMGSPVKAVLDRMVQPDAGYEMVLFPVVRKVQKEGNEGEVVSTELSRERSEELQSLAAAKLINLDMPERTRRKIFGGVLLAITLAVNVWLVMEKAGFWSRFAVTPLLFFGAAYFASGQIGICNIAQRGMWQVDGEGLKKIQDPDIAKRLLSKVNRFNKTSFVVALTLSLLFSSIPLN